MSGVRDRVVSVLREDICAWLRANDIDPNDVPTWTVPTINEGTITCVVYLRRDGRMYLVDDDPALGSVTVPLKEEPPEKLHVWLDL